ncbi:MAG: hypothetical protein ABIH82_04785 [Candidatus Woesearchaeota archaeon]
MARQTQSREEFRRSIRGMSLDGLSLLGDHYIARAAVELSEAIEILRPGVVAMTEPLNRSTEGYLAHPKY